MPQQYKITKSATIDASSSTIKPLIIDFEKWPRWSPWQKVDPDISFTLGNPSSGLGAHQFWESTWGTGEMTIADISTNKIKINVLFNQEHIVDGLITFSPETNGTKIDCELIGEVNTPIIGGYLALLSKYILTNSIQMSLNNINSVTKINSPALSEINNDSQNSPSEG